MGMIKTEPEQAYGYKLEGLYLFNCKRYQDSLTYFSQAIERKNTLGGNALPDIYLKRSQNYINLNNFSKTLDDLNAAQTYFGQDNFDVAFSKAICYINLKEYDNALKELGIAKRLASDDLLKIEKINKLVSVALELKK